MLVVGVMMMVVGVVGVVVGMVGVVVDVRKPVCGNAKKMTRSMGRRRMIDTTAMVDIIQVG